MVKCLIVDDLEPNLYLLEAILKGNGYEVESARNGSEALEKARQNPPDVVISDILMPVMDGYDLCREWKADETLKHIPLVFYTATYTDSKDEAFALSLGADRFVIKPQEPDVLIRLLREVLDESYSARQVAARPLGEEMEIFRQHNEILFRKLEKKMADLEKANRELQILEEKYRLSFENATDVIYTLDTDLVLSSVSPCVERLLGYKPEDFVGRSIAELAHILTPESLEWAVDDLGMVLLGNTIPSTIYRFIARDGSIKHGEVSGSPIRSDGEIIGVVSIARDVTERRRIEEELRSAYAKRQELEFIIDRSPAVVWLWRAAPGWPVEYVSGNIASYGYMPDDFTSGRVAYASVVHPEDLARVGAEVEQYTRDGRTEFPQEYRIFSKSGEIRWIDDRTWVRRGPDGAITHYQGIALDITDRRLAEEALRESESRFRELFERMCSCAAVYEAEDNGLDFVIRDFNRAAERLENVKREDILGRRVTEVFPGVRDFGLFEVFQRVWKTGRPEDHDVSFYQDDRIAGWRENHVFRLPSGEVVALYEDVTAGKQMGDALQKSEAKYRTILEEMDDAYFELDLAGNFTFFNDDMIRKTGYSHEELEGMNYRTLISPETYPSVREVFSELYKTGRPARLFDYEVVMKDGQVRDYESWASLRLDEQGRPIGFRGMARDITARKESEKRLQETLESLRKALGITIQVMVAAVETRDPYTAGHQLRIAGLSQAIAGEMGLSPDRIEGIRMAAVIHDIGKLYVPAEILSKPTRLREIEYTLIKEHAQKGYEILKDVESPWPIAEMVRQHHERMDGSGYPQGLKGDGILLEARIMAVADVVESMASHRPYRPTLGIDAALGEIEGNRGILYDADVVDACLRLFREKGYHLGEG
jgi:PAS domain S-box-containing protein/putative nucleotidyltransferase with HDIG domain